jgi:hypothetical protein
MQLFREKRRKKNGPCLQKKRTGVGSVGRNFYYIAVAAGVLSKIHNALKLTFILLHGNQLTSVQCYGYSWLQVFNCTCLLLCE